jgi:lipopolysaccharide/colanic/teichoic acid biosynthesis glycosyltransferase
MSLVGPRPEAPRYVARYSAVERRVLELVPGVTDEASIRYADESTILAGAANPEDMYVREIMRDKIRLNLTYAARATVSSDFRVILATLRRLFWRSGTGAQTASPRRDDPSLRTEVL